MYYLSKHNDVYLFCLNNHLIEKSSMDILNSFAKGIKICNFNLLDSILAMAKAIIKGEPLQVGYYNHNKHIRALKQYSNELKPDVVFVQFVRMAPYVENLDLPRLLDFQDALSANMKRRADHSNPFVRMLLLREFHLLQRYEDMMFDAFDKTAIITNSDRREINSNRKNETLLLPNGIDNAYFNYNETPNKLYDIMFCGNMSYHPNIVAAKYLVKQIMPLVWKKIPEANVLIAGAKPSKSVRRLASSKIKISGYVDDMKKCYCESLIFVAPMTIGSGLQNKLLEAMAIGLPVITSPLANNALEAKPNEQILVANDAADYALLIENLLNDESARQKLAKRGKLFVKQNYNWENISQSLENTLDHIVKQREG
jgi:glycosyltransferase involved in cell wall biosynthesis